MNRKEFISDVVIFFIADEQGVRGHNSNKIIQFVVFEIYCCIGCSGGC